MRVAFAMALALGLAIAAPGCSRAGARVSSGIELYDKGAYEGALVRFRDVGAEESALRTKTRARYLAYRGLAHWHLARKGTSAQQGQHQEEARRYLAEAQAAFAEADADAKWLPADVREELAKASAELGLVGKASPSDPAGVPTGPTDAAGSPPGDPSATPPTPPAPTTGEPASPADPAAPAAPTGAPPAAAPPLAPIPSAATAPPAEPL